MFCNSEEYYSFGRISYYLSSLVPSVLKQQQQSWDINTSDSETTKLYTQITVIKASRSKKLIAPNNRSSNENFDHYW